MLVHCVLQNDSIMRIGMAPSTLQQACVCFDSALDIVPMTSRHRLEDVKHYLRAVREEGGVITTAITVASVTAIVRH